MEETSAHGFLLCAFLRIYSAATVLSGKGLVDTASISLTTLAGTLSVLFIQVIPKNTIACLLFKLYFISINNNSETQKEKVSYKDCLWEAKLIHSGQSNSQLYLCIREEVGRQSNKAPMQAGELVILRKRLSTLKSHLSTAQAQLFQTNKRTLSPGSFLQMLSLYISRSIFLKNNKLEKMVCCSSKIRRQRCVCRSIVFF